MSLPLYETEEGHWIDGAVSCQDSQIGIYYGLIIRSQRFPDGFSGGVGRACSALVAIGDITRNL
jgi:hypothetical protein